MSARQQEASAYAQNSSNRIDDGDAAPQSNATNANANAAPSFVTSFSTASFRRAAGLGARDSNRDNGTGSGSGGNAAPSNGSGSSFFSSTARDV
jgi:hypothetical protein